MSIWLKINTVIAALFIVPSLFAQTGTPLIANFKESEQIENQNWAVCQNDQNEMLFANPRGLLSFDGQSWKIINTPIIPFALAKNPYDELVYFGGNADFGYLNRDSKGFYQYKSLSEISGDTTIITNIHFTDSSIYFYGPEAIYLFNSDNHSKLYEWRSEANYPFTGMVFADKDIFIKRSMK